MSKRRVRGKKSMPDYWEWSCDFCGKIAHSNSNATRPPGWVPKGHTIGHMHDFCSAEHEAEFNKAAAEAKAEDKPEAAEEKESAPAASEQA